jgi:hypothetical protein
VFFDEELDVSCCHGQVETQQIERLADGAESIVGTIGEFPSTEHLVDGLDNQPLEESTKFFGWV